MALSTSPASVSFLAYDTAHEEISPDRLSDAKSGPISLSEPGPVSLSEFVHALPPILRRQKEDARRSPGERVWQEASRGTPEDPVSELFGRLDLAAREWEDYALFDPARSYTRNLVATDGETFTLLLLCWNPGRESPIHDHPCDGCWLRVCQGKVRETRYEINGATDRMEVTSDEVYEDDAPAFMSDSMGYHKVGNPSATAPAATIHLYCPPFDRCRMWPDPGRASRPSEASVSHYSDYGVRRSREMFEVNMI